MVIVHIHFHVKPEMVDAFRRVASDNARDSSREPGVARFEVIQQADDPTRFVLVEHYRTPEDVARHRDTAHFRSWNEASPPMLAEPKVRVEYTAVYPAELDHR
jgi:quinol monooxygenase YgiN